MKKKTKLPAKKKYIKKKSSEKQQPQARVKQQADPGILERVQNEVQKVITSTPPKPIKKPSDRGMTPAPSPQARMQRQGLPAKQRFVRPSGVQQGQTQKKPAQKPQQGTGGNVFNFNFAPGSAPNMKPGV